MQIGDITVTQSSVMIPSGRYPVAGSVWTLTDMSRTEEKVSTVGIVLAVVGFLLVCFLSLLFLLMKDRTTTGFIQVSVQGDGFHHATMIPAYSPASIGQVWGQVNYVRSLAAHPPLR
jgi:hypothetical protein